MRGIKRDEHTVAGVEAHFLPILTRCYLLSVAIYVLKTFHLDVWKM